MKKAYWKSNVSNSIPVFEDKTSVINIYNYHIPNNTQLSHLNSVSKEGTSTVWD